MTVTHDEYPFDFMIPYNPKDWVLTGILENPPYSPVPFRPKVPFDLSKTDMIAICCEKVFCANKTEAAVRVAAVNRNLKVGFSSESSLFFFLQSKIKILIHQTLIRWFLTSLSNLISQLSTTEPALPDSIVLLLYNEMLLLWQIYR